MIIIANEREINVESVISTTIRQNGKSYPALKFVFGGEITAEDIEALASGNIAIDKSVHDGYTTLGEISLIVGKVTTAEAERDSLASELTATKAEHAEMKENVSVILPKIDDKTAVTVKALFPKWEDCVKLGSVVSNAGYRFTYNGNLYKCKNPNPTFQSNWIPGVGTESLYERIDETHAGTADDPIPYDGNMALESGKYYRENGVTYLCTRDTVNPVYHALSELVGQYVELV